MLNKNEANKMRCELWSKVYAAVMSKQPYNDEAEKEANQAVKTFNEVFGEVLEDKSKRDEQNEEWEVIK